MKTKIILNILICIAISSFIATQAQTTLSTTANRDNKTISSDSAYTQQEIAEAKELMLTVPELRQLPSNVKAKRRASIILAEYTELSENQYKIAITEEEAEKLGVTSELYKASVTEIEMTNKMAAEMIKEGKKVDLPDIQAIVKAYKRGELSLPIVL